MIVSLGETLILRDINLDILSGLSTAVVELSGCGKTTLLRTIAGLVEPQQGRVVINGSAPQSHYGQGVMAFLFQEAYLWHHLTVAENLNQSTQDWHTGLVTLSGAKGLYNVPQNLDQ